MKATFRILLLAIIYVALFVLGSTTGLIHPMCYAYVGAVLPLLFAFVYLYSAKTIKGFGAAAVLNGFVLLVGLLTGEADTTCIVCLLVITALAEIIRYFCGYDTVKGVRWSFIPFAFSFFAYSGHWWTDTDASLAAAVEEMPAGYDQMMISVIENIPMLVIVLILTIPVAILAMRLAERVLNKK